MDQDQGNKFWFKFCQIFVVVIILLFALSWSSVDPLYYGLKCNSFTKQCDDKNVYQSGRYMIGPLNYFIPFPANLRSMEFSSTKYADSQPLKTRTKEGLALGLHISFQYQLQKENVPKLYKIANTEYEQSFQRIARNILLQIAGDYEAPQYWEKREKIGHEMMDKLNLQLQQVYADCKQLQLLVIDLPDSYENSIVDTQVQVQMRAIKEFEQQAEMTRQEIITMKSILEQQINVVNATAQGDAVVIRQNAVAQAQQYTIDKENEAYKNILENTKINKTQLDKYIYYNSIMDHTDGKLIVGLNNAIINLGN